MSGRFKDEHGIYLEDIDNIDDSSEDEDGIFALGNDGRRYELVGGVFQIRKPEDGSTSPKDET